MIQIQFLSNLTLAFVWLALTGNLSVPNFIFGYVLTFFILWIITPSGDKQDYFKKLPLTLSFVFYFLNELVKANLQVAYDVITPQHYMKPGVIQIPLDAKTNLEITLLANFITLTPGTLSLDVSTDRKVLYVHSMYINNREEFVTSIKDGFEKRLLKILR